jgi:hypothetical protein
MASRKSFLLIDLPYLPVKQTTQKAWLLRPIYHFRPQLQEK